MMNKEAKLTYEQWKKLFVGSLRADSGGRDYYSMGHSEFLGYYENDGEFIWKHGEVFYVLTRGFPLYFKQYVEEG